MSQLFKQTPSESTGFLLWKTTNLWQREIKKTLKPFNLTHTQFVVLASAFWLSHQKENITQVEIAEFSEIDTMMNSNVIKKLIENGYLVRTEHKTDTRAKVIKLTEKGTEKLKKAIIKVEEFDMLFFDELSNTHNFNVELTNILKK